MSSTAGKLVTSRSELDLDHPNIEDYLPSGSSINKPRGKLNLRDLLDISPTLTEAAGAIVDIIVGSKSSNFWILIIFEGDLAQIAAQHVKKEDRIHISRKLIIDSPPPNVTYSQSNVQVHNLILEVLHDLPMGSLS